MIALLVWGHASRMLGPIQQIIAYPAGQARAGGGDHLRKRLPASAGRAPFAPRESGPSQGERSEHAVQTGFSHGDGPWRESHATLL